VPIDHQFMQHKSEVDRTGAATDRALIEAREWLRQHTAAELVDGSSLASGGSPDERSSREWDDDHANAESVARTIALRKLTARARTRYELDQALQAKNVPQSVTDSVLDRLQEIGLIDDASFAIDWIASRQQRRHLSRRALRRELVAKGVEREEIDRALDRVDPETELTAARDIVERRRAAMAGLGRDVQYRRLAGILSRRGFDASLITQVLRDVMGE
jgi:regulatory protein